MQIWINTYDNDIQFKGCVRHDVMRDSTLITHGVGDKGLQEAKGLVALFMQIESDAKTYAENELSGIVLINEKTVVVPQYDDYDGDFYDVRKQSKMFQTPIGICEKIGGWIHFEGKSAGFIDANKDFSWFFAPGQNMTWEQAYISPGQRQVFHRILEICQQEARLNVSPLNDQ